MKVEKSKIDIIKVIHRGTYKDGGTNEFQDKNNIKYFVDKRINSKTRGRVFNKYPGDNGAKILDIILEEVNYF